MEIFPFRLSAPVEMTARLNVISTDRRERRNLPQSVLIQFLSFDEICCQHLVVQLVDVSFDIVDLVLVAMAK